MHSTTEVPKRIVSERRRRRRIYIQRE